MAEQMDNGEQTFLDQNGDPLSGGLVFFYAPGTSAYSPTWQDPGGTVLNTQPVVLDQAGRAVIWGIGRYRQVVEDQFGNVQWDRTTSAGITVPVTGQVTGDLSVTGNAIINGSLSVASEVVAQTLNVGQVLHVDQIALQTPSNNAIVFQDGIVVDVISGQQDAIHAMGNIIAFGNRIIVRGNNSPSFAMDNTLDGTEWVVTNTSSNWQVQRGDGNGAPVGDVYMQLRGSDGVLIIDAGILPLVNQGCNLGDNGRAWGTVYAHNYITQSTLVDSPLAKSGFLDMINKVPVKTEPHLGIAKEDLASHTWSQVEENEGVNYNVLVGALWKALQELSSKFDAYIAAHP